MEKVILHEHGRYRPIRHEHPQPDDNWPYDGHPLNGNDPQYGIRNPKFERHIYIRRDQLLFDIDVQIQMVAEMRKGEDGVEDDRMTNATQKYQQMFYRWIEKHTGMAKKKLQAFVLEKFKTANMNSVKDNEEVDIELLMPEWWDDTAFDQLTESVHDYIVNAVLQEYFTLAFTSKDPVTQDKALMAEKSLDYIKELGNSSKPGRIRKPFKPF